MSDKKKLFTIAGLIIVVAFSFLMFFGANTNDKTGIDTSAFIFTIVTEIIAFGSVFFLTSKKVNVFSVAGISSATVLYTIVSLLFNVVFINVFKSVRGILVFNFAILLVYAFVIVLVLLFKKGDK